MSKEELETAVLNLPVEERASLVHKLIASLDTPPNPATEEAWIREAEQRAEEVTRGTVDLVDGDEVFRKAYARRPQK